ncbi:2,3-bisphosphoglycerate-independent phosphoglycerate mutase, partial [Patescibacteria group bacterium]|nr:2,3-bisphosphoglycerate-independent phosphoglycerate mutase [Patescibacteria group bacterium]
MSIFDIFRKKSTQPPVVLLILDGWGYAHAWGGNAISMADTPNFEKLFTRYPHFLLEAAEEAVGLPASLPGNSEVGHVAIGAGKIIHQHLTLIENAIKDGSFFQNEAILKGIQTAKERDSKLHIWGMLSTGTMVHGSINHVYNIVKMAKDHGLDEVYIHGFSDGRDAPQREGFEETYRFNQKLKELGVGKIATITGRYYAMDRNKRYERTEKTYKAMVLGEGKKFKSADEVFTQNYSNDVTDEYILPSVIVDENGEPTAKIETDDVVIFANFRADRTRQISKAFCSENYTGFKRENWPKIYFVSMAYYSPNLPPNIAFSIKPGGECLAEAISNAGLTQYHLAETQKYPHVTFFINGGKENPFPKEERQLVQSIEGITYDRAPRMSIDEVAPILSKKINARAYDAYICNFANPDMTGHTGDLSATIEGCEATDEGIDEVWQAVKVRGGTLIVTADHGNAEEMVDIQTGRPNPEHTRNKVPMIVADAQEKFVPNDELDKDYVMGLRDVAPTMLHILGVEAGEGMTGKSLVKRKDAG